MMLRKQRVEPLAVGWAPFAAHGVYGCIVVLALLLALEDHPPPAFEAALLLGGMLASIVAAESFAALIGREAEYGRLPTRGEWRRTVTEHSGAFSAAPAPLLLLVLAGSGVFAERVAFTLSRWFTIVLLFVLCWAACRLSSRTRTKALLAGAVAAAVGVVLANFHSLTHG